MGSFLLIESAGPWSPFGCLVWRSFVPGKPNTASADVRMPPAVEKPGHCFSMNISGIISSLGRGRKGGRSGDFHFRSTHLINHSFLFVQDCQPIFTPGRRLTSWTEWKRTLSWHPWVKYWISCGRCWRQGPPCCAGKIDAQYFTCSGLGLLSEQGKTEVWEVNDIFKISCLIKAQREAKSRSGFQSLFPPSLSADRVAFKNPTPRNANMWQTNETWPTAHLTQGFFALWNYCCRILSK